MKEFKRKYFSRYGSSKGNDEWYDKVKKSPLTPPKIVFPIAWTFLYCTLIFSLLRFIKIAGYSKALIFYAI